MGSVSTAVVCPVCGMIGTLECWYNTGSESWDCPVCGTRSSYWAKGDLPAKGDSFELSISGAELKGRKHCGCVEYARALQEGTPIDEISRCEHFWKSELVEQPNLQIFDRVLCDYTVVNGKIGIFKWVNGHEPSFLRMAKIMTDPDTGKEYLVANDNKFSFGTGTIWDNTKPNTSVFGKEYARQKVIYDELAAKFVDEDGRRMEYTPADIRISVECALFLAEMLLDGADDILDEDGKLSSRWSLESVVFCMGTQGEKRLMMDFAQSKNFCVRHFVELCGNLSMTKKFVKESREQLNRVEEASNDYHERFQKKKDDFYAIADSLPNIPDIRAGHPYLEVVRCYENEDTEPYVIKYDEPIDDVREAWHRYKRDLYNDMFRYRDSDLTVEDIIKFNEEDKRRYEEAEKRRQAEAVAMKAKADEFLKYFNGDENKCYENKMTTKEYWAITNEYMRKNSCADSLVSEEPLAHVPPVSSFAGTSYSLPQPVDVETFFKGLDGSSKDE